VYQNDKMTNAWYIVTGIESNIKTWLVATVGIINISSLCIEIGQAFWIGIIHQRPALRVQ
jgi:hypothetical protein